MRKLFTPIFGALVAASLTASVASAQTALPYEITFTQANSATWTKADLNADGDSWGARCWSWFSNGGSMAFNLVSSQKGAADDWFISPPFALEAGTQYEISYRFYGYSSSAKTLPVALKLVTNTTAPEASGMVIASYPNGGAGSTNKNETPTVATFTAPADGTFHIGAHVTAEYSSAVNGKLMFNYFSIKALQKASAPGVVGALTVTPGADGAETATISFTAPAIDAEGTPLTGAVKVKLYREDSETPFYTSPDMEPGTTGTAVDSEAFAGETWYIAKAENGSGEGAAVRADAWIGEDVPVAVGNMSVAIANGKLHLTWNAPATGVHGGYYNSEGVTYAVSRVTDGRLTSLGNVAATSYTDEALDAATQVNVSYQVVPLTAGGAGTATQSRTINYGAPLSLPFAESMANGAYATSPWRQEVVFNFDDARGVPTWSIIDRAVTSTNVTDDNPEGDEVIIASQDTDKGFLRFNASEIGRMRDAAKGRLVMPAVDFSTMQNPVLSFWMFRETYYTTNPATNGGFRDDYVTVEVATDNGAFAPVEGAEFHRYGKQNAWVLCEVPLFKVAGAGRVQVGFNGAGFGGGPIYIDNIRIEERTPNDLIATAFAGPQRVRVGETATFTLTVKNGGGVVAEGWTASLLKNGAEVATVKGSPLRPGKSVALRIPYTPAAGEDGTDALFTATVNYAADEDLANNASTEAATRITAPLLPAATGLTASEADGSVTLVWKPATYLPAETLVEQDGFEAYEPFAIDTFGDFTSYDLDQRITCGIGAAAGVTYPGSGEKMAYQVFTPSATDIDDEEMAMWAPHSGANMVIAPQAVAQGDVTASNDWLVFPALSGNAQTIKFFARSVKDTYSEFVQGFYSTTANPADADDFLPCPDGGNVSYKVPAQWTELSYSVPKNAKRFALRHVSGDGYVLMVDDVTYERAIPTATSLGFMGYNIYCNGEKVNDTPVSARTFTHYPDVVGNYNYTVTAVYPTGESSKCPEASVTIATLGVDAANSGASVYVAVSGLEVTVNAPATLATPAGVVVDATTAAAGATLRAAAPGVYLLTVCNATNKVVLR